MYKELGVGDYGMFKQVLRRVAVELQRMPDNPTNYPILLLEVPRQSPVGALRAFCRLAVGGVHVRLTRFQAVLTAGEEVMATVSNMAKNLATDAVGNAPTHAPPSAF